MSDVRNIHRHNISYGLDKRIATSFDVVKNERKILKGVLIPF